MHRLVLVTLGLLGTTACLIQDDGDLVGQNVCRRYAEYVCVCHADDPAFDGECDTLRLLAQDPDGALLDQCETDLRSLRSTDEAAGLICDA